MFSRAIVPRLVILLLAVNTSPARGASFIPSQVGVLSYGLTSLSPAWGDYDGDGDFDLPLYRNDGNGRFTEIPGFRDLLAGGNYHGASWCDFDRDGDLDVSIPSYVVSRPDRSLLLRNDGRAGFVNIAPALGMDVSGNGETPVWGDFDADGWPDLFIPYYRHVPPHRSFLYRNLGDGTFSDVTSAAGIAIDNIIPEGAHAADFDDDGDLDLYCGAKLFQNDGTGVFVDVREQVGLPFSPDEGSMFVDYDNDGDLDFYLRTEVGPQLFRHEAGSYTEVTAAAGLPPIAILWGDSWADADQDGDLDLLIMVSDGPAQLMLNQGDGAFAADPAFSSLGIRTTLSAWADYDRDGDLDLVVGDFGWTIYENQRNLQPGFVGSWINVVALDAEGRQTQHGATIRLRRTDVPGSIQTRVVDGGSGYLTQSQYDAHFGVDVDGRYSISVSFPSKPADRVIVDENSNPALRDIHPGSLPGSTLHIMRDGRVVKGSDGFGVGGARLAPPQPNPARSAVLLRFQLSSAGRVSLRIVDISGRTVQKLDLGELSAGPHAEAWGRDDQHLRQVRPGIYMVELVVNGVSMDAKRVVLL